MSSRRQLHREKDVQEYVMKSEKRGPAASLPSNSNENRPMDEISLLKKGLVDKDGHRHNLRSGKPFIEKAGAITLQELTSRGLVLDNGKIIYGLEGQGQAAMELQQPTSSSRLSDTLSARSGKSTGVDKSTSLTSLVSQMTLIEPVTNTTTYRVGLPHEAAFLRMGDTQHGKRYELVIGTEFQLLLMETVKTSSLTVFKDA